MRKVKHSSWMAELVTIAWMITEAHNQSSLYHAVILRVPTLLLTTNSRTFPGHPKRFLPNYVVAQQC